MQNLGLWVVSVIFGWGNGLKILVQQRKNKGAHQKKLLSRRWLPPLGEGNCKGGGDFTGGGGLRNQHNTQQQKIQC